VLTATVVEFHKVSPDAAYLLLPYLGWSTFAAVLTLDIWKRNPEVPLHICLQCQSFSLKFADWDAIVPRLVFRIELPVSLLHVCVQGTSFVV